MVKIGLLSDTHGYLHPKVFEFFKDCSEIWHAGDFGNIKIADSLNAFRPLKGVFGNIDGQDIRIVYPQYLCFMKEDVRVLMTHIGGYPGHYEKQALARINAERPGLFISGHSHILKVIYDKKHQLLHINPGAAGTSGFHKSITMVRFVIEGNNIRDLEVFDLPR